MPLTRLPSVGRGCRAWFARGFDSALPSFEQEVAARHAGAEARSLRHHVDEFGSVRALAFIIAGHVEHHASVLKNRYGV